jgi:hypothetical protein
MLPETNTQFTPASGLLQQADPFSIAVKALDAARYCDEGGIPGSTILLRFPLQGGTEAERGLAADILAHTIREYSANQLVQGEIGVRRSEYITNLPLRERMALHPRPPLPPQREGFRKWQAQPEPQPQPAPFKLNTQELEALENEAHKKVAPLYIFERKDHELIVQQDISLLQSPYMLKEGLQRQLKTLQQSLGHSNGQSNGLHR